MASTTNIASSFPRFSDPLFPKEIRDLIWHAAIDSYPPRTAELRAMVRGNSVVSTAPIPPLLHACKRARALARKRWTLASFHMSDTPKTYFDFEHDTLLLTSLSPSGGLQSVPRNDREKVMHVAFSLQAEYDKGTFSSPDPHDIPDVAESLRNWPALKSVGFVDLQKSDGVEVKGYAVLVEGDFTGKTPMEEYLLGNFKRLYESAQTSLERTPLPEKKYLEVKRVDKS